MYKKTILIFMTFISVLFLFNTKAFAASNEKALGLDDNPYYISYGSNETKRVTFSEYNSSTKIVSQGRRYVIRDEKWVLLDVTDIDFSSYKLTNVRSNHLGLFNYLKDNNLIVGGEGTLDPPLLTPPTLEELMKDLFQGLLKDLKTLLPICLGVFSLLLGISLMKRVVFSHLS